MSPLMKNMLSPVHLYTCANTGSDDVTSFPVLFFTINTHLELGVEGEEEGLACAIKAVADLKGLGRQRTKHLNKRERPVTWTGETPGRTA